MANSLVPPAAGPMFLVGVMQIPIGLMMVTGTILGLMTASTGYLFARWVNRRMVVPVRDSLDARLEDIKLHNVKEDSELPSLWFSVLPVVLPLVFICADTFIKMSSNENTSLIENIIHFLGDKNIALIIAAFVALLLVVNQKKTGKGELSSFMQSAIMSGGAIILITCAGGAFGGMLQQTGISAEITRLTSHYQMALIPLSFLIAAIIRTAQGSATVAVITTSGILAGMAGYTHLQYHPVYIGLAIGCGSKLVPWMNDAGFWIVCKVANLTEKEALKTLSPLNTIMGIVGLIIILIGAYLVPLV